MSWRQAFQPWGECPWTDDVAEFIRSVGLVVDIDDGDGDDCQWISYIECEDGGELYNREDGSEWTEVDRYLPDNLITLLDAIKWASSSKPMPKTRVGYMAKLPLP